MRGSCKTDRSPADPAAVLIFGNEGGFASAEDEVPASVIGALRRYLAFINLFIMLMSILGNRRS